MTYIYALLIGMTFTVVHIIAVTHVMRKLPTVAPIFIHFCSGMLNFILLLVLSFLMPDFNLWFAICVLAFGVSGYLFVFGAVYKSLSLRMLLQTKAEGGKISLHALDESITQKSFQDRVELLIKMGCCTQDEKGYHLSPKGERTRNKLMFIRKTFGISSLGLY